MTASPCPGRRWRARAGRRSRRPGPPRRARAGRVRAAARGRCRGSAWCRRSTCRPPAGSSARSADEPATGRVLDGARRHPAHLGARPGHRGRRPASSPACVIGAVPVLRAAHRVHDRVPAADPVGRADPAGRSCSTAPASVRPLVLVVYASFWQVLVQVLYGVADVDPVARDTARVLPARPPGTGSATCVWPTALPYVVTGIRLAASVALILADHRRAGHRHARPGQADRRWPSSGGRGAGDVRADRRHRPARRGRQPAARAGGAARAGLAPVRPRRRCPA